jgi:DNA-directed RNA polymerase subunit omega
MRSSIKPHNSIDESARILQKWITLLMQFMSFRLFQLRCTQNWLIYSAPDIGINTLNAELCKKALEKVGNPNVLINLVSRRVRQLNSGGGSVSRPLIADTANMGAADIALAEIIEEKMGFEVPELAETEKPANNSKKRAKKH